MNKICLHCGKILIKVPKETYKYFETKKYCSMKCGDHGRSKVLKGYIKSVKHRDNLANALLGNKNGYKTGKRRKGNGYLYIFTPNHPLAFKDGTMGEHRLVMEKHLGRYLTREEVVHHINNIPFDNRIENLELFPNKSKHMSFHILKRLNKI